MAFRDKDPRPEQVTAEWNGSRITIQEPNVIVEAATISPTSIYDRSDFPFPIERVHIGAHVVESEGEQALALDTIVQLDRANPIEWLWLNERFITSLGESTLEDPDTQQNGSFSVQKAFFGNSHVIFDSVTNTRFLLWIDHTRGQVHITNNSYLTDENNDKKVSVHAEPLHTVKQADQFKGIATATAMVADFIHAFGRIDDPANPEIKGLPLRREYMIGKENRAVSKEHFAWLGKQAAYEMPHSSSESDDHDKDSTTSSVNDLANIETFRPEDALKLDDIGGLEDIKKTMRDIALSFKHPEIMEKWGAKRPQGVLLYGEPGTGKTMLAQALASEIGADMWALQSTDIYDKWLGGSEQQIKQLFERARASEDPIILFFDEFDSIVGVSEESSGGSADRAIEAVAGIFKQEMNTLAKENPNVLVVAATNKLDKIDPSLIRSGRFDHRIYVPMPDQAGRQEIIVGQLSKTMLANETEGFRVFDEDLQVTEIVAHTDGFSGADITEIFRRLTLERAMQEVRTGKSQSPITQAEIEMTIRNFRQGS